MQVLDVVASIQEVTQKLSDRFSNLIRLEFINQLSSVIFSYQSHDFQLRSDSDVVSDVLGVTAPVDGQHIVISPIVIGSSDSENSLVQYTTCHPSVNVNYGRTRWIEAWIVDQVREVFERKHYDIVVVRPVRGNHKIFVASSGFLHNLRKDDFHLLANFRWTIGEQTELVEQ
jgi:DNA-dependent RNA polymerase auxiliary subunit epsilon